MKSIQLSASVRSTFSRDGAVVMHIQQGLMYTSNPVGGRMLELLSQGQSSEQVIETISRECETEPTIVRADLEKYLELLNSYGIVEPEKLSA